MEGTGLGNEVGCADWDGIMRIGRGCGCGCWKESDKEGKHFIERLRTLGFCYSNHFPSKKQNEDVTATWHSTKRFAFMGSDWLDSSSIPLNNFICSHPSQLNCQSTGPWSSLVILTGSRESIESGEYSDY